MMPNKHSSAEKLTVQRLAGNSSKPIGALDYRLDLPLVNKRSKAHAEAIQPFESKNSKNKHSAKSKRSKRRKQSKRARLFRAAEDSSIRFDNFSDVSQLMLNGSSSRSGDVLRLTPTQEDKAGSAFVKTPYRVDANTSFKTRFKFRLSGGNGTNGGSGMVFMLQNDGAANQALGGTGSKEGYGDIRKSLAIEFDTFKSGTWDSSNNHVSLLRDGDVTKPLANANLSTSTLDLNSGKSINTWIDYDSVSDRLSVFMSTGNTQPATAVLTSKIDLQSVVGTQAFAGFSAGTGGNINNQDIESWEFVAFSPAPTPVPAPSPSIPSSGNTGFSYSDFTDKSNLTLNGNAVKTASPVLRLTPDLSNQAGSAFVNTPFSFDANTSFSTRFQFRLSGKDGTNGGSGMVFMLQNDDRLNPLNALGGSGGQQGYGSGQTQSPYTTFAIRRSLALEFDTYNSGSWDGSNNHISLLRDGNVDKALATTNLPASLDLNSGSPLNAWIDYDGITNQLSVFLSTTAVKPTAAPSLTANVDLTGIVGSRAFVGFSAGTGGTINQQDIENWQFSTYSPTRTPTPNPNPGSIQGGNAAETLNGTGGNDEIWGQGGNDTVNGNDGNDLLIGGTGNDRLDGGIGIDTVSYAYSPNAIAADLSQGIAGRTARIMPLGDSITLGVSDDASLSNKKGSQPYLYTGKGGYRAVLSNKFQQNGLSIDFVGTQTGGTLVGDKDNEGHGGKTIDFLSSNISGYLNHANPDVVLLMAGTNNVSQDTPQIMANKLGTLVQQILDYSPDIKVRVASIAPRSDSNANAANAAAFNNLIPGVVASKKAIGRDVEFVDMRSETWGATKGLTLSDIVIGQTSNVHPNDSGYDKMGNFWFDSLNSTIGTAQGTYKVDQDTLVSIENLIGSVYNDSFSGNSSNNLLAGGYGSDSLRGNGGADTFFYQAASDGTDTIADFDGDDRFQLSASGFGGGLAAGVNLSGSAASTGVLVNGDNAISGDPTFLYSNGSLWFDLDGTGAGSRVEIAKLATRPASLSLSQLSIVA
ncbi:hypothetical protein IFO70_05675 [Phormidium tenue FACHB-886]|nr:hypothetical protein [Phormidium tenue FACHB-886]